MPHFLYLLDTAYDWNVTVYSIEIVTCIIATLMVIVGLMQNKKGQSGLTALNGGNEELFINVKERGFDKRLSQVMTVLGIILFVFATIIALFSHLFLASASS